MGHPAKHARVAGILSLCLLLSSLGASGVLASAAPPAAPLHPAPALVFGTGSCVGTDACTGAVGPIGDNSCNGTEACRDTTGSIGDGSCNDLQACKGATGNIGNYSCDWIINCQGASSNIGDCEDNDPAFMPPICEVQPDGRIRRSSGELWGNNIYNETGANQYVSLKIYAGDKRIVYISIQNDSPMASTFGFCACKEIGEPTGISIRYFIGRSNHEITGKFTTPLLAPGETYVIRARVAVDVSAVPGQLYAQLAQFRAPYSNNHDAVAIWVQRKVNL